ncbi:Spy/CpxP family protein refolding chaperone [Marinobacter sp.]|uniref:Spy/CpxP family protein refolding chaperone n=1 Tax=Marinobacter sp. TaxID=50741 RepID=UPI002B4925D1|nr:Spy/CpxP family protein refolding chaperone [Marinobacter sp.]HKK55302.1 Spy/CpxP family protein refolding chaperone [Marinobacter sp.]
MKLVKLFGIALIALGLSAPAIAQQSGGDQVDQLAQMVGLSEEQQTDIRAILGEMQGEIESLKGQVQQISAEMQTEIKPDYDEAAIRDNAKKLGEITGDIAALSTLMQARVDSVFTEEQREELNKQMQQMQQMQQQRQMQQRQMQQQQQGQGMQ